MKCESCGKDVVDITQHNDQFHESLSSYYTEAMQFSDIDEQVVKEWSERNYWKPWDDMSPEEQARQTEDYRNRNIIKDITSADEFKPEDQGKTATITSGDYAGKSGKIINVGIFSDDAGIEIDGKTIQFKEGEFTVNEARANEDMADITSGNDWYKVTGGPSFFNHVQVSDNGGTKFKCDTCGEIITVAEGGAPVMTSHLASHGIGEAYSQEDYESDMILRYLKGKK